MLLGWSDSAAVQPLSRRDVSAKLSWNDEHLVEAAVHDLRKGYEKSTRFVQSRIEWDFDVVPSTPNEKAKQK